MPEAAREVATRRSWNPEWLNDEALAFMTNHDGSRDWTVVLQRDDVKVSVAAPELLTLATEVVSLVRSHPRGLSAGS